MPWTRFASRERSPGATSDDFYIVYLWAFDGSAVYLSLNQGTTDFVNGEYVRKPLEHLGSSRERARRSGRVAVLSWRSRAARQPRSSPGCS